MRVKIKSEDAQYSAHIKVFFSFVYVQISSSTMLSGVFRKVLYCKPTYYYLFRIFLYIVVSSHTNTLPGWMDCFCGGIWTKKCQVNIIIAIVN